MSVDMWDFNECSFQIVKLYSWFHNLEYFSVWLILLKFYFKEEELVKLHKAFRVLEIWVKQPVLLSYLQAMDKLYSYMLALYYAIDVLNIMCIRWRKDPSDHDIVTLL